MTTLGTPLELVVRRPAARVNVLDWNGDGPPVVFLHPNGFCAGLFEPLATRLAGSYRCLAVDLRGHGATRGPTGPAELAFAAMAEDVAAALDVLGLERVDLVGQSLGGGVGVLVDRLRPGLVRRMVLCEAVAFPITRPPDGPNAMADAARRRRRVWPDRDAMRSSYRSKAPLSELGDEFLAAYLRWGVVDRADGRVELACDPRTEAAVFELSPTPRGAPAAWAHLADLHASAVVVAGERSFLPAEFFAGQAERAGVPLRRVEGGHFLLQEDGDRAAQLVSELLAP